MFWFYVQHIFTFIIFKIMKIEGKHFEKQIDKTFHTSETDGVQCFLKAKVRKNVKISLFSTIQPCKMKYI